MNIYNIKLNSEQITGNPDGTAVALDIAPGYKFEGGNRTDIIEYIKVSTVFVDNGFDKMNVKVYDLKIPITREDIERAGGKKKVKFKNLIGKIYRTSSGEYAVSASADTLEVLP